MHSVTHSANVYAWWGVGGGEGGKGPTAPESFKPVALSAFYLILRNKSTKGEGCKNKTS